MQIMIKKTDPAAVVPHKGSKWAAGYDLHVINDGVIRAGETVMFHTGLAFEIPKGYFGAIFARSGLSTREGLRPSTCVSVIDADYRGEVTVALHNDSEHERYIWKGNRVAQLVILPCQDIDWKEVDELGETERGEGGFGSSGHA